MTTPLPGDPWFEPWLDEMESRIQGEIEREWAMVGSVREDEADREGGDRR